MLGTILRRHYFAVVGRAANLAAQPAVGLFAEWRAWLDPLDFSRTGDGRPYLAEEELQVLFNKEWRCMRSCR